MVATVPFVRAAAQTRRKRPRDLYTHVHVYIVINTENNNYCICIVPRTSGTEHKNIPSSNNEPQDSRVFLFAVVKHLPGKARNAA